jgi:peptidoglycan/xylan/chitin deacetylase (PgdA/CDA1 family)
MRFIGWFTGPEGDANAVKVDNNSLDLLTPDTNQTLYARFETRPAAIDHENPGLPILMYHFFYNSSAGQIGEDSNWMDIQVFKEHLAYFSSNNYYYPTWDEVVAYIRGEILLPQPSVVLTADDGNDSFFSLAAPLVLEYGVKMTSFPILIDMDPSRLTQFDRNRIFLESHSYDMHRGGIDGDARLLTASHEEILDDVKRGREILDAPPLAYCLPYGKSNPEARQALADAGVGVALAIINDRAYPLCDPMEVPRLRINDGASVDYLALVAY